MKNFLRHLFLPRENNNYRPGLLSHKSLLALILFFFSAGIMFSFVKTNFPSVLGSFSNISNQQLLILTNQQRQNNNLGPLTDNQNLDQAAANKASDMFSKDYWAHNAPDGTTPWVFIKSAGYNYVYAGENLARGFTNAQDVITAWMNSPEHRQNVLSPNYQNVGFAVETGKLSGEDTVLVVEMLGSTSFAPAPVATEVKKPAEVAVAPGSPTVKLAVAKANVPTPIPVVAAPKIQNTTLKPAASQELLGINSIIKPLINSQTLSLNLVKIVLFGFILVLISDMIIIERKKIVRFVGHNLDHVIFFSLILIIVIILVRGVII
jgi:uncharacterized protein YkwD